MATDTNGHTGMKTLKTTRCPKCWRDGDPCTHPAYVGWLTCDGCWLIWQPGSYEPPGYDPTAMRDGPGRNAIAIIRQHTGPDERIEIVECHATRDTADVIVRRCELDNVESVRILPLPDERWRKFLMEASERLIWVQRVADGDVPPPFRNRSVWY